MSFTVTKIKKKSSNTWYNLPVPMEIKGGVQTLDSGNSGRDNNTGIMYRDIVREDVATYECTLPSGIDNVAMKDILNIIMSKSFNMYIPDIRKGYFTGTREFYNASAEPEIEKVYTAGESLATARWIYKEYTFKAVEI